MSKKRTEPKRPDPKKIPCASLPAVRGIQGGREYYTAMVPIRMLHRLMTTREEDQDLPPELRAQRKLNKTRANKIADYVASNARDYVLSSLTVSIDAVPLFEEAVEGNYSIGTLIFPLESRILINDGQHRFAGLVEMLKDNPDVGDESISVIFFVDAGLKRSQQMFTDLNKNVSKTSKALNVLYDHRDPIAELSKAVVNKVPGWKTLFDMERPNPPRRSPKLHSLNNLYDANVRLLKHSSLSKKDGDKPLVDFWSVVQRTFPDWIQAANKKVSATTLREDYLHAHGIALVAIAEAFKIIWRTPDASLLIKKLEEIDWSRTSKAWKDRCVVNGRIVKSATSIHLASNFIKKSIGIDLSPVDREAEKKFKSENS